jgi:hypothetical protein
LAGAQQVVDELPADAQRFSGLVRAVREPLDEGIPLDDLARPKHGEAVLGHPLLERIQTT